MRVGIYLRMSLDRTGEELGIDRYRSMCLAICERRGWGTRIEYVDNDVSATKPRGPKSDYARLLADVRAGNLDVVITPDIDRLTRIPREIEDWIEWGQVGKIRLITADGEVDTTTENGRMYLRIKAAVARHEVERKGRRQRDEARQRADRGLPPGGRRAFGYATGGKQIRTEAAAVKRAYADLLAGATLSSIAAGLNARGLATTMGGRWKHNAVRGMLLNPRYAGLRTLHGVEVGKGTWRPIVTEDVFRAAVAVLRDPDRRTNHRGNALTHLGSNLYLCGRCATDELVICTYRGAKSQGTQRRVYRCPACYLTRAANPIDEWVELVVVERLRRPDLADLLAEPAIDAGPLRDEATALRRRLDALADNLDIDEQVLARRSRRLRDRLDEVRQQLSEAGRGSAAGELLGAADPGQVWLDYTDVGRRQGVVRDLLKMRVRLLQAGPGRRVFNEDTVDISWAERQR